jgi:hypothetical protein
MSRLGREATDCASRRSPTWGFNVRSLVPDKSRNRKLEIHLSGNGVHRVLPRFARGVWPRRHGWAGSHNDSHDRIRVSEAPCQIQSFTLKLAAAISPRLNHSSAVSSIGRLHRLARQRRSTRADLSAATSRHWVTSRSAIQLSTCRSMTFKRISTRQIHLVAGRSCRRSISQLEHSRGFRTPRETR